MKRILIVDDEVNIGLLLSKFLSRNGFEVKTATSGATAFEILERETFNLVLCDFRLEDTDGREILKKIKLKYPRTGVIIITGYSDIKLAVELIKMGAYDYITKPLYPDEILNTIKKAIDTQQTLNEEMDKPKSATESGKNREVNNQDFRQEDYVVGQSAPAKELIRQIDLVAPT